MFTGHGSGSGGAPLTTLEAELAATRSQVAFLNVENTRLPRVLELTPLQARTPGPVQTGTFDAAGSDCPVLDTLFLTAPIAFNGRLVQYVGRIMRPYPEKATAEVHDYHDLAAGVLASSLTKRASGYASLGFPDPRRD